MDLPASFTSHCQEIMGDQLSQRFFSALSEEPPVSIRLHPWKSSGLLPNPSLLSGDVPWCKEGHYLKTRPNFTFDPLLHAGAYYVQDASSMFIDHILRQHIHQPVSMLDLCAAPGGKTTAALSALPQGSLVFANEPIPLRAQILSENIQKWGYEHVVVTNNYPEEYLRTGLTFDLILTDVPCSGEGMFRKDANAITEWSPQGVETCRRLQREIVETAWKLLRPGGLLIYSTCTMNIRENEENAAWMIQELGATPVVIDTSEDWGITHAFQSYDIPVYRFIPGFSRGEGLFMTVMQKDIDTEHQPTTHTRRTRQEKKASQPPYSSVLPWLTRKESYVLHNFKDEILAIPQQWEQVFVQANSLRILHAGIKAAVIKGRDIVPHHSLALSLSLCREAFTEVALDYAQAIAYLRKETLVLPPETPRGHTLLTYHGLPLGFAKNIGNRANNLYPPEWKIRTQHTPENNPEILIVS